MYRILRSALLAALTTSVLAACVYYESPPGPGQLSASPSNFERAWYGALAAAQDAGITLSSQDQASGVIRGSREGIAVTIQVWRQADGSVRVQFDAKGPVERDPDLSQRFSQAYDRRTGRY
ncbi:MULTISPECIES: hypothetical protein [unclassified Uliginosibacterium]|uniref:hypothetical protein n=1 Tax=unclassified Uliginosibacterium TaxID=2621521 RepID=UPI000C7BB279|nr:MULTISPECIES: hypothetical protein [unclassified Uliginosibacterium]MDO6386339.1 hypothetical protein [Uliginosibacterium sp. 31-12]PLK49405.1 hypothetical protein C0V76_09465 [Uliginosibacterium sp. TH139]